jgi:hypothetical protein
MGDLLFWFSPRATAMPTAAPANQATYAGRASTAICGIRHAICEMR